MSNFTSLLISTCDIQQKSLATVGYETKATWSNLFTGIATRKDVVNSAKITDGKMRENADDDFFFFNPGVAIKRGHRIVFGSDKYDVIKVNTCYGASSVHHLEVIARLVDHD